MSGNQATLGNGCVCDSGCPSCDALAKAWTAMRKALTACPTGYLQRNEQGRRWLKLYNSTLTLVQKVTTNAD